MKYPIGIQDFREIRTGGYVYVDKTPHIHRVLDSGKYYFLSRPRRFGKSLLLATMNELYCGAKELFEGLWIHDQWDWETSQRPVIWLKFAKMDYKKKGLEKALVDEMQRIAKENGLYLETDTLKDNFGELISKIADNQKVVLLVDEYDKPIIDFLDDVPQAEANRDVLKSFYSILKDSDALLEKIFITGVSAFSKVSIFSDLNHLTNLTIDPLAYTLLGITQAELEMVFAEQLAQHDKEQVKRWYNGYSWGSDERVYNPFSILRFLSSGQYQNFWFETGTPTFLVKEMKRQKLYDISNRQQTYGDLTNFDFTHLNPITVLFQTGYLTVKKYEPEDLLYTLDYPNREVQFSLEQMLMAIYMEDPLNESIPRVVNIRNALRTKDINTVIRVINSAFAGIPSEHWQKENEHFYRALIHLTFSLLGTYIHSEVNTANGRCDAVVETANHVYAFEFKLDQPAQTALKQIHDKGYLTPYADSPKEKIAVGVSFSKTKKAVVEWLVEDL
ncbi:MAG TPA: AAA family ATPase [Saprospiraceae bacterium]|nr:AAA family ATPase [Saprospiraceae bacterium]HMQ82902.1 AAA family ATPase [Saprospiraceae bacterium]